MKIVRCMLIGKKQVGDVDTSARPSNRRRGSDKKWRLDVGGGELSADAVGRCAAVAARMIVFGVKKTIVSPVGTNDITTQPIVHLKK